MTSPRDALRALEHKMRAQAETSRPDYYDGWIYEVATGWADQIAAILQQMDSEPTVAQWRDGQRVEWTNHLGHTFAGTIEHRFPAVRFDDGVFRVFADNEFDQLRSLAAKARQL